jgi:uncharacterized PurR-regulated membrane protein YhhQ (DUF165 family)
LYVTLIVLANWLASKWVWPVGFGYEAPAGVFAIGLILGLRDWLHELRGLRWTLPLVYVAAGISWGISVWTGWSGLRDIAIGSVVAFTVSETVDSFIYAPFRRRWPVPGLVLSNSVGLVVDSAIFLYIAFGSLDFLAGQIIGKAEMTVLAVVLVATRRYVPNLLLGHHGARRLLFHSRD